MTLKSVSSNHQSKVTMADIAGELSVSPATVSLALRNRPGVSQETRQRILQTAHRLGYPVETVQPRIQPAVLNSIGLILKTHRDDELRTNYFYAPVLTGIEAYCREQHINLFYAHLQVDEDNNPVEPPRLLKEQQAGGLLFVGILLNEAALRMLERQGTSLVLVDAYAVQDSYDAVVSDNEAGAYDAVSYLIAQGHRQIAIAGSLPHSYPSIQERRNGYLRAMADHGLSPAFIDCHHHREEALPAAHTFLPAHPDITAVFGCNDEVAIAVIEAARALGIGVPDQLSVMGFDNISLAQHVTPALTTMRIDKMGMGRLATQLLLNRITHPEMGQVRAVIRPSLVERESVRPR
jgi:LacI family transcriptional regulator